MKSGTKRFISKVILLNLVLVLCIGLYTLMPETVPSFPDASSVGGDEKVLYSARILTREKSVWEDVKENVTWGVALFNSGIIGLVGLKKLVNKGV